MAHETHERLFELIQILRDGRVHTARDMAARLEVSVRTFWRDMATLIASRLPEALAAARHLPFLRRAICRRERVVIDYIDGSGIA